MVTRPAFLKSILGAFISAFGINEVKHTWAQALPEGFSSTTTKKSTNRSVSLPSALAKPISALWMNGWELPTLGQLPSDVVEIHSLFIMAMAQSAGDETGKISWAPVRQTPEQAKADIAGLLAKGKKVSIGIGGSSDGGIHVTNEAQVMEMFGSIEALVNRYGFTGIDLDLEPSGGKWSQEALKSLCSKLKAEYGKAFIIGITPSMYGPWTEKFLSAARFIGLDGYDYWAPMLYDFPEAHDDRLSDVARDKVRTAVAGGVPANRQILGFMCNAYYNTSPVPVTLRSWRAVKAEFPDIAGAFIWESKLEGQFDYEWTRNVGKVIRGL